MLENMINDCNRLYSFTVTEWKIFVNYDGPMPLLISHSESVKPYHFHNITYNVFLVNLYIEWEMRKTNEFFSLTFCDIFRD